MNWFEVSKSDGSGSKTFLTPTVLSTELNPVPSWGGVLVANVTVEILSLVSTFHRPTP
jgi:hypothetical protein